MKKIIIILSLLLLTGCSMIERAMLPKRFRPESNVPTELKYDVSIIEVDFGLEKDIFATAFFEVDNKLYFSKVGCEKSSTNENRSICYSEGVFSYDLNSKKLVEEIKLGPTDSFWVNSILVFEDRIFVSGGEVVRDYSSSEFRNYEISMFRDGVKKTLMTGQSYGERNTPKLVQFDGSSFVFIQEEWKRTDDSTTEVNYELTWMSMEESTESLSLFHKTIKDDVSTPVGYVQGDSVDVNGNQIVFTYSENNQSYYNRVLYDLNTKQFTRRNPVPIRYEWQAMGLVFLKNAILIPVMNFSYESNIVGARLDVFDPSNGNRIASQNFQSSIETLEAIDDDSALVYAYFIPLQHLYIATVVGDTIEYQAIDGVSSTTNVETTRLSDGRILIMTVDSERKPSYRILEFTKK